MDQPLKKDNIPDDQPTTTKHGTMPRSPFCAQFVVPSRHVKLLKNALESRNLLTGKITPHDLASKAYGEPHMSILTNIELRWEAYERLPEPSARVQDEESLQTVHTVLDRFHFPAEVRKEIELRAWTKRGHVKKVQETNPMVMGLIKGLETLPPDLLVAIGVTVEALVEAFPASYVIYRPLVLLPHNSFASSPWKKLLEAHPFHSLELRTLWEAIAASTGVTHIGVNAGIPPQTKAATYPLGTSHAVLNENVLRSPTNLTPVYGDFGETPSSRTLSEPTITDLENALWVSHTQNGIHQTWAPLYTMFSRGNIREKARLLTLPSVTTSVQDPRGCTAVDLYAGIGYFAFSYKRAGVSKVLCWELNPWSIEGLCRGAKLNGSKISVFANKRKVEDLRERRESDFLVFPQSNEFALSILPSIKQAVTLPPIRHVNCGFLPSSKLSWGTAVGMVDRELGGWIHAHENVGVNEIETRKEEVLTEMEGHLDHAGLKGQVRCEHVERVKTYAPGVLHVVFDVWIGPTQGVKVDGP